jgi:flagellar biosynthesis protein
VPDDGRPVRRAAALRYEGAGAPRVVAAGAGEVAQRIVDAARAAGVPVREDSGLADALSRLALETEIPPELYVAVAEALVWAHGLDIQSRIPEP